MVAFRSRLLRRSRPLHRWLGATACLFFAAMGVSGTLLNHPGWLCGADLPRAWLPGDYAYRDWNRNSLRGSLPGPGGETYLFGEAGVWEVAPGQAAPRYLGEGFERSVYYRDTRALLRLTGHREVLLAATRAGLLGRVVRDGARWRPVPLPGVEGPVAVVDLLEAGDRVLAVTRSRVYAAAAAWPLHFRDVTPPRAPEPERRIPLFRLVFHAHSGATWGAPGRLLVDAAGVVLTFASLTGGYFWWRRRRGSLARGVGGRLARKGLTLHLRLGRWGAPLLLLVALTGLLQRPPFLVAIAFSGYPERLHPGPVSDNPWDDLLRQAAYDPQGDLLTLATADGFYRGRVLDGSAFRKVQGGPPVSVMGATVFRHRPDGLYWVGSMSGLFLWDARTGWVTDAFTGNPPLPGLRGPVGARQIVGLLRTPGGELVLADYAQGLLDADGRPAGALLPMPAELREGGRISLWHALFEFHNGRLFGFLLGSWAWVVVPLGGLALAAEVVSGACDAWLPRWRRRR